MPKAHSVNCPLISVLLLTLLYRTHHLPLTKHARLTLASGPLHLLFLLPRHTLPQLFTEPFSFIFRSQLRYHLLEESSPTTSSKHPPHKPPHLSGLLPFSTHHWSRTLYRFMDAFISHLPEPERHLHADGNPLSNSRIYAPSTWKRSPSTAGPSNLMNN